jgi:hypothetical protein
LLDVRHAAWSSKIALNVDQTAKQSRLLKQIMQRGNAALLYRLMVAKRDVWFL